MEETQKKSWTITTEDLSAIADRYEFSKKYDPHLTPEEHMRWSVTHLFQEKDLTRSMA